MIKKSDLLTFYNTKYTVDEAIISINNSWESKRRNMFF